MYYQYLDDRGPWNRERIWYPYRADDETSAVQPAVTLPPIANLGDGPSGLVFYPGVGLPDRYQGHFFMADFRGTAGNSGIRSFTNTPKGATFELADAHQFIWSILATDVDFAPDASMVVSDWVNGWNGEGKGRLYRFEDEVASASARATDSAALLGGGIVKSNVPDLVRLFTHADRRVRQQAQFELVRRNGLDDLLTIVRTAGHDVSRLHGLWGCWQAGLSSVEDAKTVNGLIREMLSDPASGFSTELQTQAIKVLTDLVSRHGFAAVDGELRMNLTSLCKELTQRDDLRLAGFAATALGTLGTAVDAKSLLTLLDRNNNVDPVVRHQASMGLVKLAERHPGLLEDLADYAGTPGRLGVVLAMRRQGNAAIAQFLKDGDSSLVAEAARAINDEPIEAAQSALADLLGTPGLDDNTLRRSMNAGYRRGFADDATAVARIAADAGYSAAVRTVAAQLLATWNTPQNLDTVTGRWRPLHEREVQGLEQAVSPHLPGMLAGSAELRQRAVDIAMELGIEDMVPALEAIMHDTNMDDALRTSAFRALAKLSPDVPAVLQSGLKDPSESVRLAAVEIVTLREPQNAVPRLKELLDTGSLKAQQTALRLLGPIRTAESEAALLNAFERLKAQQFSAGAVLDLITAAEVRGSEELKAAVAEFRKRQQESGTLLSLWNECLEGGDVERGKTLFFGRSAAACRRCHKVAASGGEVGPDLSKIGKEKDRSYLLEAMVDPSAKIAKGFETVIIVTMAGRVHSGILKSEDDSVVQLMTPTGALISVAKDDIDERANGQSGMPQDIAKNLTRAEIRDLVEYMTTLQSEPAAAHGKHE
ncbi:MAG: c-type cytochrome [Fuerstia sp.]|nr:c-type cytochrome [Fuerstiella sp.]